MVIICPLDKKRKRTVKALSVLGKKPAERETLSRCLAPPHFANGEFLILKQSEERKHTTSLARKADFVFISVTVRRECIAMDDLKHVQAPAAPFIFAAIFVLNFVCNRFFHMKKKVATNLEEVQVMQEIKRLLKEANSLSTPSTFAQAAMLRRAAAAKEKELLEIRQIFSKDKYFSDNLQTMAPSILKVCIYLGFAWWFWGVPVAGISIDLLQPFGNALSWRLRSNGNGLIMIGIIPWLLLATRVSAFVSHKLISK